MAFARACHPNGIATAIQELKPKINNHINNNKNMYIIKIQIAHNGALSRCKDTQLWAARMC
jgi:hypothetical protein